MVSNRTRSRYKKRRRKLDSEISFINILGDVFSEEDKQISQDIAESIDVNKGSIPGQDVFMEKQKKLDKAKD